MASKHPPISNGIINPHLSYSTPLKITNYKLQITLSPTQGAERRGILIYYYNI